MRWRKHLKRLIATIFFLFFNFVVISIHAQAPGSTMILTGLNVPGGSHTDAAETLYIGPGSYNINGGWHIYSKYVWVSADAVITGSGQLVFYNSATAGGAGGPTIIDGNSYGNVFDVNVVHHNEEGIHIQNLSKPAISAADSWDDRSTVWWLSFSKNLDLAVDGADIWIGDGLSYTYASSPNQGGIRFGENASVTGFNSKRMFITQNKLAFVQKVVVPGTPITFTFPIGIADGDYTPMTLSMTRSVWVGVVDYSFSTSAGGLGYGEDMPAVIAQPEEGVDRAWFISSPQVDAITLQHNVATNGSGYDDATAYITQIDGAAVWDEDGWSVSSAGSEYISPGVHGSGLKTMGNWSGELYGSFFTKTSDPMSPLPVQYGYIKANVTNGRLMVEWQTLSETNNEQFEIEASRNGKTFVKIGEALSKAKDGNSSISISYEFDAPISPADIASGIVIMSLGVIGLGMKRRHKVLFALLAIAGLSLAMSGCEKSDSITGEDGKLFIRLVQVNKDVGRSHSKVIQAIKD